MQSGNNHFLFAFLPPLLFSRPLCISLRLQCRMKVPVCPCLYQDFWMTWGLFSVKLLVVTAVFSEKMHSYFHILKERHRKSAVDTWVSQIEMTRLMCCEPTWSQSNYLMHVNLQGQLHSATLPDARKVLWQTPAIKNTSSSQTPCDQFPKWPAVISCSSSNFNRRSTGILGTAMVV